MAEEKFVTPPDIVPGSPEEAQLKKEALAEGVRFDLKKHNAMRGYIAFKGWHYRLLRDRDNEWLASAKAGDTFPYAAKVAGKRRIFDGAKLIWIDDPEAPGEEPWDETDDRV